MARVDASFSTFLMVHNCLAMLTIGLLGSEAQKSQWLPRMASLEAVGCWALTEPSNGSDASALTTRAEWVGGKWRITGQKRWIGNGTFAECVVVWARNTTSGQVCSYTPPCRYMHSGLSKRWVSERWASEPERANDGLQNAVTRQR